MNKKENKNAKIAFLLLAAGASSRMGQPKQLLPWKDSTFLEHTISQVKNIPNLDIFVLLGANHQVILDKVKLNPSSYIIHFNWKNGMGNSLAFGVQYIVANDCNYEAILVATVDQPLIKVNEYKLLIKRYIQNKNIISCSYKNNVGVPAIFPKKYFNKLQQLEGDRGAKKIIIEHIKECETIDFGDKIVDIDTLEQYKQLYRKHSLINK